MTAIADRLGSVLGQDVEVTVTADGGYRAHLSFESAEAALELAARLQPWPPSPARARYHRAHSTGD